MNKDTSSANRTCQVCGKDASQSDLIAASAVRPVVVNVIKQDYPEWSVEGFICVDDLNRFRYDYIRSLVETERGELSDLEKEVVESLAKNEILSTHIDQQFESKLTFGQRLSDKMASFGGSWRFIIIFTCVLILWISINSLLLALKPFDPYPFILLNLILSCLAAIQAPIIMMSQNRQETKDRLRASYDYQINLKAELEIRQLHQKLDHLLTRQWERLIEIQEVQIELLNEMRDSRRPSDSA
jgi:uncharacterized membrane protein